MPGYEWALVAGVKELELAESSDEGWTFLIQSKWQRLRDSNREVCWRSSASGHREAEGHDRA